MRFVRIFTDVLRFQWICAGFFVYILRRVHEDFWSYLPLDFINSQRSLLFLPIVCVESIYLINIRNYELFKFKTVQ